MSTSDPRRQGIRPDFITLDEAELFAQLDPMAQHRMIERAPSSDPRRQPGRALPDPPPDDMLIDIDKWNALTRLERRGLLAEHRRVKKASRG